MLGNTNLYPICENCKKQDKPECKKKDEDKYPVNVNKNPPPFKYKPGCNEFKPK